MINGCRCVTEKGKEKIIIAFSDRDDVVLKSDSFVSVCRDGAEKLVKTTDANKVAKADIELRRASIEASIPDGKEKDKALAELDTGEFKKEMKAKAKEKLIYVKQQHMSAETFGLCVNMINECLEAIAKQAGLE